jgi:hypothetical protein
LITAVSRLKFKLGSKAKTWSTLFNGLGTL